MPPGFDTQAVTEKISIQSIEHKDTSYFAAQLNNSINNVSSIGLRKVPSISDDSICER